MDGYTDVDGYTDAFGGNPDPDSEPSPLAAGVFPAQQVSQRG